MSDPASILPPNATALERALERAMAIPLDAYDVPVADLWSPDRCPVALLPYLAWALSVDDWDDAWPEDVLRAVCRAALPAHVRKGSPGAVKEAVAAIYETAIVREWFETGGPRFTFTIEVGTLRGPRSFGTLLSVIHHTKPLFVHLAGITSRLAADHAPRIGMGVFGAPVQRAPWRPQGLGAEMPATVGVAALAAQVHAAPWRSRPLEADCRPRLAVASDGTGVQRARWRARGLAEQASARITAVLSGAGAVLSCPVPNDHPHRRLLA